MIRMIEGMLIVVKTDNLRIKCKKYTANSIKLQNAIKIAKSEFIIYLNQGSIAIELWEEKYKVLTTYYE